MNAPRLLAYLLAISAVLPALPACAQSGPPRETPLFVTAKNDDDRMDERIYPFGWSADGKFAWLSRKVEEASDDGMWELLVLDVTSNKVVENVPLTYKDKAGEGLAKFWAKHGKTIQATLSKHRVKTSLVVMDHLPVVLGKRRNSVVAASIAAEEKEMESGPTGVKSFKVTLRLGEARSVIFEKTYETVFPFAVSFAGCFHSPDEKFAVLVITVLDRGYEGAPHPREVEAMAGFKLEQP